MTISPYFVDPRPPPRSRPVSDEYRKWKLYYDQIIIDEDGCWIWQKATNGKAGYGITAIYPDGKIKNVLAHRYSYELFVGPIPEGFDLDHTCHNESACREVPCKHRLCVNPRHLAPKERKENLKQGRGNASKTHCPKGHEYSEENTRVYDGGRQCVKCTRKTALDRYYKLKEAAS